MFSLSIKADMKFATNGLPGHHDNIGHKFVGACCLANYNIT